MKNKVVLITGASSGFGQQCANYLSSKGYVVYGTSRNASFSSTNEDACDVQMIPLDVGDFASINTAVAYVLDKEQRIDVLINNAGFGIAGAVEDVAIDELMQQMDTNFLGVVRVCKAVLPHMRKRQSGCIINISSIGGVIAMPFQSSYSSSKFAVEGFTEALSMEVKPYNIQVVLIQPGDFATDFSQNRVLAKQARSSAYVSRFESALAVTIDGEKKNPNIRQFTRLVDKIIKTKRPKLRYSVGPVEQRLGLLAKKVLPSRLFEYIVMREFKL